MSVKKIRNSSEYFVDGGSAISEGKKIIGTYYFSTERSSASEIEGRMDKVPGKWRSCEFTVSKGKHRYDLEVLDRDKVVLTRFILY